MFEEINIDLDGAFNFNYFDSTYHGFFDFSYQVVWDKIDEHSLPADKVSISAKTHYYVFKTSASNIEVETLDQAGKQVILQQGMITKQAPIFINEFLQDNTYTGFSFSNNVEQTGCNFRYAGLAPYHEIKTILARPLTSSASECTPHINISSFEDSGLNSTAFVLPESKISLEAYKSALVESLNNEIELQYKNYNVKNNTASVAYAQGTKNLEVNFLHSQYFESSDSDIALAKINDIRDHFASDIIENCENPHLLDAKYGFLPKVEKIEIKPHDYLDAIQDNNDAAHSSKLVKDKDGNIYFQAGTAAFYQSATEYQKNHPSLYPAHNDYFEIPLSVKFEGIERSYDLVHRFNLAVLMK